MGNFVPPRLKHETSPEIQEENKRTVLMAVIRAGGVTREDLMHHKISGPQSKLRRYLDQLCWGNAAPLIYSRGGTRFAGYKIDLTSPVVIALRAQMEEPKEPKEPMLRLVDDIGNPTVQISIPVSIEAPPQPPAPPPALEVPAPSHPPSLSEDPLFAMLKQRVLEKDRARAAKPGSEQPDYFSEKPPRRR